MFVKSLNPFEQFLISHIDADRRLRFHTDRHGENVGFPCAKDDVSNHLSLKTDEIVKPGSYQSSWLTLHFRTIKSGLSLWGFLDKSIVEFAICLAEITMNNINLELQLSVVLTLSS